MISYRIFRQLQSITSPTSHTRSVVISHKLHACILWLDMCNLVLGNIPLSKSKYSKLKTIYKNVGMVEKCWVKAGLFRIVPNWKFWDALQKAALIFYCKLGISRCTMCACVVVVRWWQALVTWTCWGCVGCWGSVWVPCTSTPCTASTWQSAWLWACSSWVGEGEHQHLMYNMTVYMYLFKEHKA